MRPLVTLFQEISGACSSSRFLAFLQQDRSDPAPIKENMHSGKKDKKQPVVFMDVIGGIRSPGQEPQARDYLHEKRDQQQDIDAFYPLIFVHLSPLAQKKQPPFESCFDV